MQEAYHERRGNASYVDDILRSRYNFGIDENMKLNAGDNEAKSCMHFGYADLALLLTT